MDGYSIFDFLRGAVRGFNPSDDALQAICLNAGVDSTAPFHELSVRDQRVALAFYYIWIAMGPAGTAKWSEKDGDWSQSGGGEQLTAGQIRMYIRWADDIFKEYGLATVGQEKFGMRGGGIRNIRSSRNGKHY